MVAKQYPLSTILAIAIPLGVFSLTCIILLLLVVVKFGPMMVRVHREDREKAGGISDDDSPTINRDSSVDDLYTELSNQRDLKHTANTYLHPVHINVTPENVPPAVNDPSLDALEFSKTEKDTTPLTPRKANNGVNEQLHTHNSSFNTSSEPIFNGTSLQQQQKQPQHHDAGNHMASTNHVLNLNDSPETAYGTPQKSSLADQTIPGPNGGFHTTTAGGPALPTIDSETVSANYRTPFETPRMFKKKNVIHLTPSRSTEPSPLFRRSTVLSENTENLLRKYERSSLFNEFDSTAHTNSLKSALRTNSNIASVGSRTSSLLSTQMRPNGSVRDSFSRKSSMISRDTNELKTTVFPEIHGGNEPQNFDADFDSPLKTNNGVIANLRGVKFFVTRENRAKLSDELDIDPGDVVQVFEVFDDGWCRAFIVHAVHDLHSKRILQGVCPASSLDAQKYTQFS